MSEHHCDLPCDADWSGSHGAIPAGTHEITWIGEDGMEHCGRCIEPIAAPPPVLHGSCLRVFDADHRGYCVRCMTIAQHIQIGSLA